MNYQSTIYSKYLSDEEMIGLVADEALIEKMVRFEAALAEAQKKLGIIPGSAADQIVSTLNKIRIKPTDLAEGTFRNGIPVIPFLDIIKGQLAEDVKRYLHFGVTSQDVMDSAQVLLLRDAISLIEARISTFKNHLQKLHNAHGATRCMARTRGQLAVPVTFGLKIKSWLDPVERQEQRLKELSGRLFKVQLGGAAGDLAAFATNGRELVNEVAATLKLSSAPSWHSQRDTLAEITNWLAMLTGAIGKMGADILVLSQNEIGEITESSGGGGKSSSMSHKNNPVLSEALVAIARMNATLQSQQLQSMVHVSERDATAWILEWNTIPQMLAFTASSLNHAISISAGMKVNTVAMEKNVAAFLSKNEK